MPAQRIKDAAAAAGVFAVNAWIVGRLFHTSYTVQMGSNDGIYIGLARYISAHFDRLTGWFPLWYGGVPFADSYPPLLHVTVAVASSIAGISAALAYHMLAAVLFSLGPVALYFAARCLGASPMAAGIGGLLYSVLSPADWLSRPLRVDAGGWFAPQRVVDLVAYADTPHVASLVFLGATLGLLHLALEKRRPVYYVAAALAAACTVLCNWIGAFALAVAVCCYLLAGPGGGGRWARAAAIGCFGYAMALPWVTPSTIKIIRTNSPLLVGWKQTPGEAMLAAAMVAGTLALAAGLARLKVAPRVRFGAMFLWNMAAITLGSDWLKVDLIPQAARYHAEMDLAFWLLFALAAGRVAHRLPDARWAPLRKYAWIAVALACVPVMRAQRRAAREMEQPIAIETRAESRVSHWLGQHMPGERVYAPGSIGFWMNAFSDTPMIDGGFDNGIRNNLLWAANSQVVEGERLENTVDWLKAFGCDAIVGDDRTSLEVYHPYWHPDKLHTLPELWRDGAEVIYAVPRGVRSLAHVVEEGELVKQAPFGYDPKPLEPFLKVLDDSSRAADFQWLGVSAAKVTANLHSGDLLYVQVAWDKGWKARANGREAPTHADALGQMVIDPQCEGACTVDLRWDGGLEMQGARVVHGLALGGAIVWVVWAWFRRKQRPGRMHA